jgi:hypothetical protein
VTEVFSCKIKVIYIFTSHAVKDFSVLDVDQIVAGLDGENFFVAELGLLEVLT